MFTDLIITSLSCAYNPSVGVIKLVLGVLTVEVTESHVKPTDGCGVISHPRVTWCILGI